jgi:chromosome segregation ATPase
VTLDKYVDELGRRLDVSATVIDDYEARFREYEDKVNNLGADLLEERAQRREVGEALVRVTEERDGWKVAVDRMSLRAVEHAERHQALFDEWVRERAQLVDERDELAKTLELEREHHRGVREYAVARQAERDEARDEVEKLRGHILDIDAHATPYGDIPDEPGWVGTYLLTSGALHRALGRIGHSAPSCKAEEDYRLLQEAVEAIQEMRRTLAEKLIEVHRDREEARDEVVRLGRERDEALADVDRLDDVLGEARQQIIRDAKELVRLRTIIVELGAGEAAEPEEQIEALRPEKPPRCGVIGPTGQACRMRGPHDWHQSSTGGGSVSWPNPDGGP